MNETRYCSTCGTLLHAGAAICGECGARFQASPYERRATDAPIAWSQAPRARSRERAPQQDAPVEDTGIQLITRDSLKPKDPSSTTVRTKEQYDQMMINQPPGNADRPPAQAGTSIPQGSSNLSAPPAHSHETLPAPLDGCVPGSFLKRVLAAIIDGVISSIAIVPLTVAVILIVTSGKATLLAQILIGVGAALPLAIAIVMIWLQGAKGFTVGKLIVGLRTTRFSQDGPIGFLRSLGRQFIFGLCSPLMALSVFLDPLKALRGFHDRAFDSIVVDIKDGRNPLKPRDDDFARPSADHYLGSGSVEVSAHENLLSTPGQAWSESASAAEPVTEVPQPLDAWAPPAPPQEPSFASDASGWQGQPSAPEVNDWQGQPSAPEVGGWQGQPSAPEAAGWQAQQPQQPENVPGYGHGDMSHAGSAQSEWAAPQPPTDDQAMWQPPVVEPSASHSQTEAPSPLVEPQQSAPSAPDQDAPREITDDAWAGDEVDERTRVTFDDDLGDLEQTRISTASIARRPHVVRITADDGTERVVESAVVIGRNPAPTTDAVQFILKDESRSVSKNHVRIDGTGSEIVVTDLGSTNGSAILRSDGSRETLMPDTPSVLPRGARLAIGDRILDVEREQ